MSKKFIEVFFGFNSYCQFIVLKKGDEFFPISIQGATRCRSYHC